jgi:hypothetical protein
MRPTEHLLLGTAASALLYPMLGPAGAVTFLAGSVLVDIDHYIEYVYHNRLTDFGIRRMFRFHRAIGGLLKRPEMLNVEIFHTIEFMLLLYALSLYAGSAALNAFFFGILFHIALDMIDLLRRGIFFLRCNSLTEYFIRRRAMAGRGLVPRTVYTDALDIINNGTGPGVR